MIYEGESDNFEPILDCSNCHGNHRIDFCDAPESEPEEHDEEPMSEADRFDEMRTRRWEERVQDEGGY